MISSSSLLSGGSVEQNEDAASRSSPSSSSTPTASPKTTANATTTATMTTTTPSPGSTTNSALATSPFDAFTASVGRRSGLPARNSLASTSYAVQEPFPIEAVDGLPSFYPQSLWEESKQGKVDLDRLARKTMYRLPAHKRLVAGKYVEDPDLKDFSNPSYKGPSRSNSTGPSRLSRLGEFLGTSSRSPPPRYLSPLAGDRTAPPLAPPPVYAAPIAVARGQATRGNASFGTTTTGTSRSNTSASFSTAGSADDYDEDEDDADEYQSFEECEEEQGPDGASRLPPIDRGAPPQHPSYSEGRASGVGVGAGRNAARAAFAATAVPGVDAVPAGTVHSRNGGSLVKQTYPVVEPLYPFSAASFYFPIYYGRLSPAEKADPRGLPQCINEEFHPNDRADMPLSSVAVQKDNLNRMGLFKIGPGAVAFKVVICAFEAAGMKYTTSNSKFNILWAKRATPYTLASLTPYQKVNHFPGTWGIGRKDSLAQNMTKMRRFFGEAVFDIVPTSFLLPRQEYELKADAERHPGTPEKPLIYILKPTASSCGRGIELCRGLPPMPRGGKQLVCQRYIGNPLLIFGRKFDLRLYCVVTSFDPLRVYLFDEGLVRFAAEKYTGPDQDLENVHKHLTNYSVNKTAELTRQSSGKEYDSEDPLDIKWCISDFKRHLVLHHPLGLEAWTRIQRECDDVVIKAMLSIENDVIERIRHECKDKTGRNCFELFGLDLMADEDLKVRLIEANIMPSLATASNLDKAVKARMLAHMLTLVRAMPYRRNAIPKAERDPHRHRHQQREQRVQQEQPSQQEQPRRSRSGRSGRSASRGERSASNVSRTSSRSPAVRGSAAAAVTVAVPRRTEEVTEEVGPSAGEDEDGRAGGSVQPEASPGSTGTPAAAAAEVFLPHGPEADRPERTYRFGKHPLASARIVQRELLSSFNNPQDPESVLTPYETLMLVESEEELRCAGGFRRVFPVSSTLHNYLPLFTHGVRRNNYVLCSAVMMHAAQKPKKE